MMDLLAAIGLVLVLEGLVYAAFPASLKRMMALVHEMPDDRLRQGGIAAAAAGLVILWLVRG